MKGRETSWIETGDETGTDHAHVAPLPMTRQEAQMSSKLERTQAAAMVAALEVARRYAAAQGAVLILGETGTGKTELAHFIHQHSARADKPWVEVNCGGLADSIIDSQLFGHERGAFTGAASAHPGFFEQADGGTIFLDEIGELPLEAQRKLLTVLQSGRIQRLGSTRPRTVDVRVVAATNRDLVAEVKAGRFREDLYHRLAILDLHMPPLRDRREDIPMILDGVEGLSDEAREAFSVVAYDWPGNVRELLNTAHKAKVLGWGRVEIEVRFGALASDIIQGLDREDVVVELASQRRSLRAADVMNATGLSRTAAVRMLRRLVEAGRLRRERRGEYVAPVCSAFVALQTRYNQSDNDGAEAM